MALYVIRPSNPERGADWLYEIPGQYVENIVSVSATLTTTEDAPTAAVDASGNGNDGTYWQLGGLLFELPGLVGGDTAISINDPSVPVGSEVRIPALTFDSTGDWSFEVWCSVGARAAFGGSTVLAMTVAVEFDLATGDLRAVCAESSALGTFTPPVGVGPFLIGYRFVLGVGYRFYIDGVQVAAGGLTSLFTPGTPDFYSLGLPAQVFPTGGTSGVFDELAVWGNDVGAGAFATHYAARGTFAGYAAAVLADAPDGYYHFDDLLPLAAGRTPALVVTDGTNIVGSYVSSFPAAPLSPTFDYSLLVGLSNSAQVPTGQITTVGLPPLILPAGYTIGTDTPDLGAFDQWSDIAIWWDDSFSPGAAPGWAPYDYHNVLLLQRGRP